MSIVDLIDHAIDDCDDSVDAMRWSPRPPLYSGRLEMWRRKRQLRSGKIEEWFGFPSLGKISGSCIYDTWFDEMYSFAPST